MKIVEQKEQIPDFYLDPSDTSDFPAPEGYPSWLAIQERLDETPPANENIDENA